LRSSSALWLGGDNALLDGGAVVVGGVRIGIMGLRAGRGRDGAEDGNGDGAAEG
jgi:hypothetical protein